MSPSRAMLSNHEIAPSLDPNTLPDFKVLTVKLDLFWRPQSSLFLQRVWKPNGRSFKYLPFTSGIQIVVEENRTDLQI